jgi:WD40 repeat protein
VPGLFAVSPEGTRLATAHRDQLRVWDVTVAATGVSLSLAQAFNGHEGWITDLDFRPDGQGVVTAGSDGTVRVWELSPDAEPVVFRGHTGRVGAVAFHPSGRTVASGGKPPGDIRVWDVTRKPEYVTAVSFHRERRDVAAIGFTVDGRELLALAESGVLRRWNCATGQTAESEVPYSTPWAVPGATAAFSGDGRVVAAVTRELGDANNVRVTEVASGRELAVLRDAGKVRFMACDATGSRITTGGTGVRDGKTLSVVRVWGAVRGTVIHEEYLEGEQCDGVAISPDGTQLLDARRGCGGEFAVLTDLTGTVSPRQFQVPGGVAALAFSPRGCFVAIAAADGAVRVWDRKREPVHERSLPGPVGLGGLAFSPDETRLAGVTRERIQVWDVASGQDVLFLRGSGPRPHDNSFNPRVAWSHDGMKLAASNWDRTVSVWDSADTTTGTGKATLTAWAASREFQWHRQRTETYAQPEVPFAVAFHRDRTLAVDAATPFLVRQRGDFFARLGRFQEARATYARLFTNGLPDTSETCREYAALLVTLGNHAAYCDLRRARTIGRGDSGGSP